MTDATETKDELPLDLGSIEVSGDDKLHTALLLYENKSYQKALNLLLSGFETDRSGTYANFIGSCYQKLGSANDALHFWQKAISQNPTCYQAFLGIGNVFYAQNNIKQALVYWHIALTICPENPKINFNLATAYSRRDERLESVYYYEKFLKYCENPEGKDFKYVTKIITTLRHKAGDLLKYASAAIREDKINLAVQFYIKSVKNYPMQPKVVQNIAKVFACDRNFNKAIEYYRLAIKIDTKLKVCLVDIANAYISLKKYELAYCYFMKFLNSYKKKSNSFAEIERMASYAKSKISTEYDSIKHYNVAIEHENNLRYKDALYEYENYLLLCEDNKEQVQESIKKLKLMIFPEKYIIKRLVAKIDEFSSHAKYEEAVKLCDRMIVLSAFNSQEFHWAGKKKQEIRYMLFRVKEGKK